MQVHKTLSPLKLTKKTNFLIKRQEINRDEKGNEKLCGKELHLNDICFNAHALFSQLQKPNVMKWYIPSWSLIRGVVALRLYLHWKHLQTWWSQTLCGTKTQWRSGDNSTEEAEKLWQHTKRSCIFADKLSEGRGVAIIMTLLEISTCWEIIKTSQCFCVPLLHLSNCSYAL